MFVVFVSSKPNAFVGRQDFFGGLGVQFVVLLMQVYFLKGVRAFHVLVE